MPRGYMKRRLGIIALQGATLHTGGSAFTIILQYSFTFLPYHMLPTVKFNGYLVAEGGVEPPSSDFQSDALTL